MSESCNSMLSEILKGRRRQSSRNTCGPEIGKIRFENQCQKAVTQCFQKIVKGCRRQSSRNPCGPEEHLPPPGEAEQ